MRKDTTLEKLKIFMAALGSRVTCLTALVGVILRHRTADDSLSCHLT